LKGGMGCGSGTQKAALFSSLQRSSCVHPFPKLDQTNQRILDSSRGLEGLKRHVQLFDWSAGGGVFFYSCLHLNGPVHCCFKIELCTVEGRGLPSSGPIILNPHRALRAYHDKKKQEGQHLGCLWQPTSQFLKKKLFSFLTFRL